jgi:hypothetical protein
MSKDYANAYKAIRDKAIELSDKVVLGPDRVVVIQPLPENLVPKVSIPSLETTLIALKPYVESDVSRAPLSAQMLHRETSNFFTDTEAFYKEVVGHAPDYEQG